MGQGEMKNKETPSCLHVGQAFLDAYIMIFAWKRNTNSLIGISGNCWGNYFFADQNLNVGCKM